MELARTNGCGVCYTLRLLWGRGKLRLAARAAFLATCSACSAVVLDKSKSVWMKALHIIYNVGDGWYVYMHMCMDTPNTYSSLASVRGRASKTSVRSVCSKVKNGTEFTQLQATGATVVYELWALYIKINFKYGIILESCLEEENIGMKTEQRTEKHAP